MRSALIQVTRVGRHSERVFQDTISLTEQLGSKLADGLQARFCGTRSSSRHGGSTLSSSGGWQIVAFINGRFNISLEGDFLKLLYRLAGDYPTTGLPDSKEGAEG